MDNLDNFRERVEALEQRTEHLHQQTRMVEQRLRWWRGLACGLLLVGLVSLPLPTGMATEEHADKDTKGLAQRVRKLEAQVQALQATLAAVSFDPTTKELVITGANLRIVNGLGRTDCGSEEDPIPNCPNGLGNLIVGYNEKRGDGTNKRTGSHNVVVGREHNFSSFGGLVIGALNEISGQFASVSGGAGNTASGESSSVSGGGVNTASGVLSSVSGGGVNTASGFGASVSGGELNTASGSDSSVSGGFGNTASSVATSVSGGELNTASMFFGASVSGGRQNTASGESSSVSGGELNTASGQFSSVSGGSNRSAPGTENWAAGGLFEDN